MSAITLTSKRQATFPGRLCKELDVAPGDILKLEPALLSGDRVWVLRPCKAISRPWLGCLKAKASSLEHSMEVIRASIAAKRIEIGS